MKHKYHDVIIAFLENNPIQCKYINGERWLDVISGPDVVFPNFNNKNIEYRIKPNILFYRVALHNVFYYGGDIRQEYVIKLHTCRKPNLEVEKSPDFARWLTEWTEVEI